MIGNTLSHYKIIEKLGSGGQGEVYLAEDSRLDRKVALKILPQHLSERAELRERFEREARAVSSLNHPHICTLHDIGEQDGIHYLVMEHLVGETLEARLAKGALPLEQTLEYAIQIADALDKAHKQGVVHRDLKPGNIMLVKSGAKLLDFGLAKLQAAETPTNLSALPTEQANLTAEGTILGTLQYMAPEQLEAKEADSRTDIFAFGAVVYEMATGKKAFEGKSQASLIAAIMERDPRPMEELQPMTPQLLDWVVKRCLAKEPDERVQTAADLMAELRLISEVGTPVGPSPFVTGPAAWRRAIPWSIASLVAGVIIATIALWNPQPSPTSSGIVRFVVAPIFDRVVNLDLSNTALAFSPDGTHLAYVEVVDGNSQVYLRPLNELRAEPIAGTEGGESPFFSPNGQWVGFFADGKLKKVSTSGGAPMTLCDALDPRGASWGADGTIVFTPTVSSGLWRISADGGEPQELTSLGNDTDHRWAEVLPGGQAVLFNVRTKGTVNWDDAQIVVQSLETGERRVVVEGGTYPRYVPSGYLVYVRAGTLFAQPFDLGRLESTGAPVPVLKGVRQSPGNTNGVAHYSLSNDGSLVYVPDGTSENTLVWVDRKGIEEPLKAPSRLYVHPRLSPDGRQVAVQIYGAQRDIWIYNISRETLARLTFEGENQRPTWISDGQGVLFDSTRAGMEKLFWKPADGSGEVEQLTTGEGRHHADSWSPNGQVAFHDHRPGGIDTWVLPLEDKGELYPLLQAHFNEVAAMFSPDGLWLAYVSDESGRDEIYIRPFSRSGGKRQISNEGGVEPVWARNGRELFYRNGRRLIVVDVNTQPTLSTGKPTVLFEGPYELRGVPYANFDVTSDGQRFVMVKRTEDRQTQIIVVQNWLNELKRLVPTN